MNTSSNQDHAPKQRYPSYVTPKPDNPYKRKPKFSTQKPKVVPKKAESPFIKMKRYQSYLRQGTAPGGMKKNVTSNSLFKEVMKRATKNSLTNPNTNPTIENHIFDETQHQNNPKCSNNHVKTNFFGYDDCSIKKSGLFFLGT